MKREPTLRALTLMAGLSLIGVLMAACAVAEVPPGAARVTFVVHCYDVGAGALEGHSGVLAVERGWSGFHEVDRVVYDPQQVTVEQMEEWLKEADTYVRTLKPLPGEAKEEQPR